MKTSLAIILLVSFVDLIGQGKTAYTFDPAPTTPQIFKAGLVNTHLNERDFAISPEGNEIYFTVSTPRSSIQTIVFCKKDKKGNWSPPAVAPFAGNFSDLEPAFSADGNSLYFASNRPAQGSEPSNFDLWKVTRTTAGWGSPESLGPNVNTPADEFYPSITKSGNLYFTASYSGGPGKEDIYVSEFKDNMYQKPVALDTAVNSKFYEFNAFVAPDESFVMFTSYGRKDDSGGGDLYISVRDAQGKWHPSRNVKELNSNRIDYCPYSSPDGRAIFFTSERHGLPVKSYPEKLTYQMVNKVANDLLNGNGNIYWVDRSILDKYFELK